MHELRQLLDRWRIQVRRWVGRRFSADVQDALEFGRSWHQVAMEYLSRAEAAEAQAAELRADLTRLLEDRLRGER